MQSGRYYDGQTAKPQTVSLLLGAGDLTAKNEDGRTVMHWRLDRIRVVHGPEDDRQAILSSMDAPDARLHVPAELFVALKPRLSKQASPKIHIPLSSGILLGTGIASVAVIAVIVIIFPLFAPSIASAIPASWEKRLGDFAIDMVSDGHAFCTSPKGKAALDKMIARLQPENATPFTVDVVSMGDVNAFTAPGNRILLLNGLLRDAKSAEEVAGVLAHEIGHAVHRHPMEGFVRGAGLQLVFLTMFGGAGSAHDLGGAILTLSESKHSREAETNADRTGIEILLRNRIDPKPFGHFFERLAKREGSTSLLDYLASHPHPTERARMIEALPARTDYQPLLSQQEWKALQAICRRSDQPGTADKKNAPALEPPPLPAP